MRRELKELGKPVRFDRGGLYHWRDGMYFGREDNGDVTLWHEYPHKTADEADFPLVQDARIPSDEWESIVHGVAHPSSEHHVVRAQHSGRGL